MPVHRVCNDAFLGEYEKSMLEHLSLHCASDAIARAGSQTSAVCRLNRRGSAVLISRAVRRPPGAPTRIDGAPVCPQLGVLLTTPWALPDEAAAAGTTATFQVPAPGRSPCDWETCEVRLLPPVLFYRSPAGGGGDDGGDAGYTIVACELYGVAGGTVRAAALPLPLARPFAPALQVGDTCLVLQHPNGTDHRKHHLATVKEVCGGRAVHGVRTPPQYTSSGGAVFSEAGALVGVGHMADGAHVTISIRAIVNHMFHCGLLRFFDAGLADDDPSLVDKYTEYGEPCAAAAAAAAAAAGSGGGGGTLLHWKAVWDTWYDRNRYGSVVLLLQSFYYCRSLALAGLTELCCHEQRRNVALLRDLDGLSVVRELLRHYADDSDVSALAVAALAAASEHGDNLAALAADGAVLLPELARCAEQNAHRPRTLRWTACVVRNLMAGGGGGGGGVDAAEEAKAAYVELGGLARTAETLRRHGRGPERSLVERTARVVTVLASQSAEYTAACLDCSIDVLLLEAVRGGAAEGEGCSSEDAACLEAALEALGVLLHAAGLPCVCNAAAGLLERGLLAVAAEALRGAGAAATEEPQEAVLHKACLVCQRVLAACPCAVPEAIGLGLEELMYEATMTCPASTRLLQAAVDASAGMGVPVHLKCMPEGWCGVGRVAQRKEKKRKREVSVNNVTTRVSHNLDELPSYLRVAKPAHAAGAVQKPVPTPEAADLVG